MTSAQQAHEAVSGSASNSFINQCDAAVSWSKTAWMQYGPRRKMWWGCKVFHLRKTRSNASEIHAVFFFPCSFRMRVALRTLPTSSPTLDKRMHTTELLFLFVSYQAFVWNRVRDKARGFSWCEYVYLFHCARLRRFFFLIYEIEVASNTNVACYEKWSSFFKL